MQKGKTIISIILATFICLTFISVFITSRLYIVLPLELYTIISKNGRRSILSFPLHSEGNSLTGMCTKKGSQIISISFGRVASTHCCCHNFDIIIEHSTKSKTHQNDITDEFYIFVIFYNNNYLMSVRC